MEKVSVIVPIYNVEKYLNRCVDSILNQTYKNLEVILVDDESPDNCPAICDEYAEIDKRVKVIHQKNMGLSGARNSGIKVASGKYLVFHDSDDTLDVTCVEKLYDCLKKDKTKISICGRYYEFEDGKKICKYNDRFEKKYDFEEAMKEMNSFYYFDMSACGKMFEKTLFDDIEFPVGKLSEDYYVMYKLFKKAGTVSYISEPLYNYLQRQNSISKNKKINDQIIDAAYNQMVDLENYSDNLKNIVHVAYASSFLTVINLYIKQKVKCPKKIIKDYKQKVKDNMKYINEYNGLSLSKKVQFRLFLINYNLYKLCFKLYRKKNLV